MSPLPPAPIDRETLDRILKRATQLQTGSHEIGDGMTEDEVLALGREVGIPEGYLRQALLEERTRGTVAPAGGLLDSVLGAADVVAERVVQGTAEGIEAALAQWMERREHFVLQRSTGGRVTFEPMEGFARGMQRLKAAVSGSHSRPYLDKVELVTATITPLETGFCHVRLEATLRGRRAGHLAGGIAVATVGGLMGAVIVIVGAPPVAALLPFVPGLFGGWGIARLFRRAVGRAQLGVDRVLDELERRPALPGSKSPPPPKPGALAQGVGQVVRDITHEVRKALDT